MTSLLTNYFGAGHWCPAYTGHHLLLSSIYRTSATLIQHIQDITYSYPTYTGHYLLLSNIYRTLPTLIQRVQDNTYSYPKYTGHYLLLSNVYRTLPTLIQRIQDIAYSYPTYTGHHLLCPLPKNERPSRLQCYLNHRSQTESASVPEIRPLLHLYVSSSAWTLWRWRLWLGLPHARQEAETPNLRSPLHLERTALFFFLSMQWWTSMTTCRVMESTSVWDYLIGLRTMFTGIIRAIDHACCHN